MKKLQQLNQSRLFHLEFGQHVKSVAAQLSGNVTITDVTLQAYVSTMSTSSGSFDRALIRVQKSDQTAKIEAADHRRDLEFLRIQRFIKVFELSTDTAEQDAYTSLTILFSNYKDLNRWNFERETNGITNLVEELRGNKYANHVNTLKMNTYTDRLSDANTAFDQLFSGRMTESAGKEVVDMKQLRAGLKDIYNDLCDYVLSMAKAKDEAQYNEALTYINTVRKYYADMIARRIANKTETPIPPQEAA